MNDSMKKSSSRAMANHALHALVAFEGLDRVEQAFPWYEKYSTQLESSEHEMENENVTAAIVKECRGTRQSYKDCWSYYKKELDKTGIANIEHHVALEKI